MHQYIKNVMVESGLIGHIILKSQYSFRLISTLVVVGCFQSVVPCLGLKLFECHRLVKIGLLLVPPILNKKLSFFMRPHERESIIGYIYYYFFFLFESFKSDRARFFIGHVSR